MRRISETMLRVMRFARTVRLSGMGDGKRKQGRYRKQRKPVERGRMIQHGEKSFAKS